MRHAGESVAAIAGWYNLEEFEVTAALEFEEVMRQ